MSVLNTLMVIVDGMENKDYNLCENIGAFTLIGKQNNTPKGKVTDSLNCIMNMLNVPSEKIPSGRAYLEALALGIDVHDDDMIFRCNAVKSENNILVDTCDVRIIDNIECDKYKLIRIEKHKYLLIINNAKRFYSSTVTYPPHQYIGANIMDILPSCVGEVDDIIKNLWYEHGILVWGQAVKEHGLTYYDINNKTGAVMCKTEIVKGIAKDMGMYCPDVTGATGDIDTDLTEKLRVALTLIQEYDTVVLHINGADECSHRKNKSEKKEFVKKIDDIIFKGIKDRADINIVISADHETSVDTGQHINSEVCCYSNKKGGLVNG